MDYTWIEELLDKYWNCATSLEEEEELRLFFILHEDLPPHLAKYREMFAYQQQEKCMKLDEQFDRKLLEMVQEKPQRGRRRWRYIVQAAAVLVLCLMVREGIVKRNDSTAQTPEQALQEVQQALNFVSQKLNRSQQILEKNINEIETITKYIKE